MSLLLRVTSGPQKETTIELKEGLIIGRSEGELRLADSKISGRHAQVHRDEAGLYYLQDLGSRNGIRYRNEKVTKLQLSPGRRFRIGRTEFIVEDTQKKTEKPTAAKTPSPQSLHQMLAELASRVTDRPRPIVPFPKLVRMNIRTGLQRGTEWWLGYGPRQAGSATPELTITEPGAPEICFTIRTVNSDIIIDTSETEFVRINDQTVSEKRLASGDQVRIANTLIEFTLEEAKDDR